eukprot:Rhum_TRINITY_DN13582_c0_g2::Rhum_TRINITY_DN13582_c0_g2_i1::g.61514::m.61514
MSTNIFGCSPSPPSVLLLLLHLLLRLLLPRLLLLAHLPRGHDVPAHPHVCHVLLQTLHTLLGQDVLQQILILQRLLPPERTRPVLLRRSVAPVRRTPEARVLRPRVGLLSHPGGDPGLVVERPVDAVQERPSLQHELRSLALLRASELRGGPLPHVTHQGVDPEAVRGERAHGVRSRVAVGLAVLVGELALPHVHHRLLLSVGSAQVRLVAPGVGGRVRTPCRELPLRLVRQTLAAEGAVSGRVLEADVDRRVCETGGAHHAGALALRRPPRRTLDRKPVLRVGQRLGLLPGRLVQEVRQHEGPAVPCLRDRLPLRLLLVGTEGLVRHGRLVDPERLHVGGPGGTLAVGVVVVLRVVGAHHAAPARDLHHAFVRGVLCVLVFAVVVLPGSGVPRHGTPHRQREGGRTHCGPLVSVFTGCVH